MAIGANRISSPHRFGSRLATETITTGLSYTDNLNSFTPLDHVTERKMSGEVNSFNKASVSRATHLPFSLAASGLFPCEIPAPLPSLQVQSLPKISLSLCRATNSREKALSRDSALLPELADISP